MRTPSIGSRASVWMDSDQGHSCNCNCIGPQRGEPLCPCMMKGVQVIEGRWVRLEDLGPAPKGKK